MTPQSVRRLFAVALLGSAAVVTAQESPAPRAQTDDTGVVWSAGPYSYDGAGSIKAIGPSDVFVYDKLGRLKSGTAGAGRLQEYTYDARGNILSVTTDSSSGTALKPCVDPATNQIDGSPSGCNASGTYGATGNMESYGSYATFAYDQLDMVKESTVDGARKVYLYSASDERIASIAIVGSTPAAAEWTVRDDSGRLLRRFSRNALGAWSWSEDYVYGGSGLLAADVSGPERTLHFFPDHLGTPRVITGGGGAEISRHTYYPFGQEATSLTQDNERVKFTGHERDTPTLDYMHARYYLPYAGRFLSPDPVLGNLLQPQSWNRYAYVLNDPANFIDPYGLAHKKPGEKVGPNDTCDGKVVDGWCTGFTIDVTAKDPIGEVLGWLNARLEAVHEIRDQVCQALPSGRTMGISVGSGALVGGVAGGELVVNYDTGQVSAFGFGGIQGGIGNGGASVNATRGYVRGLNGDNSNYKGGFTTVSVSGGQGVSAGLWSAWSSDGVKGFPHGSILPTGPVRAHGTSVGMSLLGWGSATMSLTEYSKPLQVGKFWAYEPQDAWFYAVRQAVCQ